jgi:hypothetical protein
MDLWGAVVGKEAPIARSAIWFVPRIELLIHVESADTFYTLLLRKGRPVTGTFLRQS